jgi:hypothetical protein
MTVKLNEVYLYRDGAPVHDHHATPEDQKQLKAERATRQGNSAEHQKASRKRALATAMTAAQWVCAAKEASRERHHG